MTTPHDPTNDPSEENGPDPAAQPVDEQPTDAIPAAEPAVPPAAAAPAPPVPPTPPTAAVPVNDTKRKWLWAGAGVGALACLGLAFGLGYITGDQTGHHGERGNHHRMDERGHMNRGGQEMPGQEFGRGRWRMAPPEQGQQNPNQQNPQQQTPGQQTPGQQTPTSTVPSIPG